MTVSPTGAEGRLPSLGHRLAGASRRWHVGQRTIALVRHLESAHPRKKRRRRTDSRADVIRTRTKDDMSRMCSDALHNPLFCIVSRTFAYTTISLSRRK